MKALFCVALGDLTEGQIKFGFAEALKFWKPEYGKKFPAPAEIREYAERYVPVDPIAETRRRLMEPRPELSTEDIAELDARLREIAVSRSFPTHRETAERLKMARNDEYGWSVSEDLEIERLRRKHHNQHRASKGLPPREFPPMEEEKMK